MIVWILRVCKLGFDEVPQDVGMQSDEQQCVERHDHAESADRQGIGGVFSHHRRWKRNERLTHLKDGVQPHHAVVGVTGQPENVVVIQPELANNDEADQPAQELGEKLEQLMAKLVHAMMILQQWDFQFENEQCDDDRENPVAERLNAGEAQWTLRKAFQEMHLNYMQNSDWKVKTNFRFAGERIIRCRSATRSTRIKPTVVEFLMTDLTTFAGMSLSIT